MTISTENTENPEEVDNNFDESNEVIEELKKKKKRRRTWQRKEIAIRMQK